MKSHIRSKLCVGLLALGVLVLAGCDMPPAATSSTSAMASTAGGELDTSAAVVPPRVYPTAVELLTAAHDQAALRYAVLVPEFEALVGPLDLGKSISVKEVLRRVAAATDTQVSALDGVAVFEGANSRMQKESVYAGGDLSEASPELLYAIGRLYEVRTLVPMSKLARSKDIRTRTLAVRLLADVEGDFMRNEWPGRVSIYELLADQLDTQGLIWAVEEGGPDGGIVWKAAVTVLGRARWANLSRHTWWKVYQKTPGTMEIAMWAIGRVNDPAAAWALKNRPERTFTNWPEDHYLAAQSLGRLDPGRMRRFMSESDPDLRAAAVYGAGFASSDSGNARRIVDEGLKDSEAMVRFVACQSLARLAGAADKLKAMAADAKLPVQDRAAALTALETTSDPAAGEAILAAAGDTTPAIRATAARLLGDLGGVPARDKLTAMLADNDATVLAEVVCSLGRLGDLESVMQVVGVVRNSQTPVDVRIGALIGLGRGHSPAAASVLNEIATDVKQPVRVRRYAIRGLAQLAGHAGAPALAELARLDNPAHDFEATRHVDMPDPEDTWRRVRGTLTAGARSDSAAAACRLSELGYGPGVRDLLEGFDVFDNSARMQHMWGAIRSHGPQSTAALIASADNPRRQIRIPVAEALGDRIDPLAVATLIKLCGDENSGVRARAAESLSLTGDPAAVTVLIAMAREDENLRVSSAAIRALRRRDWAVMKEVKELFAELAGTDRDCGVIDAERPSLDAQPANSFVLRKWPGEYDDLTITNITYESSLTYDSDRGRVVQWGAHGRRADAPQQGQTWFYYTAINEWRRLYDSRHWPNGQCLTWGTTYDPANEVVVSPTSGHGGHGWINYLRTNLSNSVPWVLDARRGQWHNMSPPEGLSYGLGQVQGTFASGPDVVLFHWGQMRAYDAYANEWVRWEESNRRPGYGDSSCWDPKEERLIAMAPGQGAMETWSFSRADGKWRNLEAVGGPPSLSSRLVYDSTNDVMIGFDLKDNAMRTWIYHLRENRWEEMPLVYPTPRFHSIDTAYDSRENVVVFSGGWETGASGEPTQRETWTYRYRPANASTVPAVSKLGGLSVVTQEGGGVKVTWRPVRGAASYRVLRGSGQYSWEAKMQPLRTVAASATLELADSGLDTGKTWWYRVEAFDDGARLVARTPVGRTRPQVVSEVWASVTDKGIQVNWANSPSGDVVGYKVYRADVDLGDPYSKSYAHSSVGASMKLVSGDKPVGSTGFLDTTAASDRKGNEVSWPKTYAYVIRPVNQWGVEGGNSPATLAIPDPTGPVRVLPWADGKRLVIWPSCRTEVAGYHVTRMDDWNAASVYRYNGAPVAATGYYDDASFPTTERRRYYIIGVDRNGTLGVPSSGAWSHGFP